MGSFWARFFRSAIGTDRVPTGIAAFHDTEVRGVRVTARLVALSSDPRQMSAEIKAVVRYPLGPRLLRNHSWGQRRLPPMARDIPDVLDAITASALPALERTWKRVQDDLPAALLACDGLTALAWLDEPETPAQLDAVVDALVAIASWDAPLAAVLAALPEATLIVDAKLSPAVSIAPDDLRIGVRAGVLVAELGGTVVRPGRTRPELLAAIRELRAAVAVNTLPYR
jgi:hypothetical protein